LRARAETTADVGLSLFLGGATMLFSALLFVYAYLAARLPVWPPAGAPELPRAWAWAAGVTALAASGLLLSRPPRALPVAPAAALAALFVVLQLGTGLSLWRAGLRPAGGAYAAIVFGLLGVHAAHALVGAAGLGALALRRVGRGATSARLWFRYWHFVGIVWGVVFAVVFVGGGAP
jgi:cytochrome c oxidase subunit 3